MTDHNTPEEAIEQAFNELARYRELDVAASSIVRKNRYVNNDDGSIAAPSYQCTWVLSAAIKAVLDAWLDGTPLPAPPGASQPPPVSPPPSSATEARFRLDVDGALATATDISVSPPGLTITSGVIHWGDDTATASSASMIQPGGTAKHTYAPGTYTIRQSMSDSAGNTATSEQTVTIAGPAVKADFEASVDGDTVTITDKTTGAASESIDYGDGAVDDSLPFEPHAYSVSGTYSIRLRAFGADGAVDEKTVEVEIAVPVDPPVTPPPDQSLRGKTATIISVVGDTPASTITIDPGQRKYLVSGLLGTAKYGADGLSINLENRVAGVTADLTGHFTIKVDDTVIFDGDLTIWAEKSTRPFWLAEPQPIANPDLSLFAIFGPWGQSASRYADYMAANNGPMGRGIASKDTNSAGEHGDLGSPFGVWDACWFTNRTPENLKVVRGMADAAAVLIHGIIDPNTLEMIDVSGNPHVSISWQQRGKDGNPILPITTADPNALIGMEHATNFCSLACAVFGTSYDREMLALTANQIMSLNSSWAYRMSDGCSGYGGAPRAIGRGWTLLQYAAEFSDKPDYFKKWDDDFFANGLNKTRKQTGLHIIQGSGTFAYKNDKGPKEYAPWQAHIHEFAVGLRRLRHPNDPDAQWLVDYHAEYVFQALGIEADPNAPHAPHEVMTIYSSAGNRYPNDGETADFTAAINAAIDSTLSMNTPSFTKFTDAIDSFIDAGEYSQLVRNTVPSLIFVSAQRTTNYGQKPLVQEDVRTRALNSLATTEVPVDSWLEGLNFKATYNQGVRNALACAEGSPEMQVALGQPSSNKPGDFMGYPTSPTGYAAMSLPGIAMILRFASDRDRAQRAWAVIVEWLRANFGDNPKYGQIPWAGAMGGSA